MDGRAQWKHGHIITRGNTIGSICLETRLQGFDDKEEFRQSLRLQVSDGNITRGCRKLGIRGQGFNKLTQFSNAVAWIGQENICTQTLVREKLRAGDI